MSAPIYKIAIGFIFLFISIGSHSEENISRFYGFFHTTYENFEGAYSLGINNDGHYSWSANACDSGALEGGTWTQVADSLILKSSTDKFTWLGKRALQINVKSVQLFMKNEVIEAHIVAAQESQQELVVSPQIWTRGQICMKCNGFASKPILCSELNNIETDK